MDSAEFLDLLGNANRRRILRLLARKPCYVTEISEHLGVSPKAVIDHLRKLEEAGLVESRTDERRRKYFSISRHVHLEVTVSPYEFGTRSAYPSNSRVDITSCRQLSVELEREDTRAEGRDQRGADAETSDESRACDERTAGPTADGEADTETRHDDAGPPGPRERGQTTEGRPRERSGGGDGDGQTAGETTALARRLHDLEQLEQELSLVHRWTEGRINRLREHLAERVEVGDPRLVSELLVALAEEPRRTEALCRYLGAPPPVVEELLDALAARGVVRREGRRWQLEG